MGVDVLIVSDVCLYREGLKRILDEDGRLDVVGTAASKDEAVHKISTTKPDVVLVDMTMEDRCSIIRQVVEIAANTKVVALAVPKAVTEVIACVEAGVSGYVIRNSSLEELIQSIEAVARGELKCSPQIAGYLLQRFKALAAERGKTSSLIGLTRRELRILELVEKGFPNKEIARALNIEVATVKNHVHSILQKLHVSSRGEAAALKRHYNAHSD
jgi:DNA-binding NarL/FixJ family response regulator